MFLFMLTAPSFASVPISRSVSGEAYCLYLPEKDEVIVSKNANKRMGMASTTKIMTSLVAIEYGNPDDIVTVSENASRVEGSSAYLEKGEKARLIDLVYSLMLSSANDSAYAIAEHISGSVKEFADLMNKKAKELSLLNTHFENPHGLDSEEHYTSAYDLAKLSAYALDNEVFREIVSTKTYTYSTDRSKRTAVNHNRLLKTYDGAIGVKTGFTKKCGRCLVSAAQRDGLRFVAVTLSCADDWNSHRNMLDYGFSLYEEKTLAVSNEYKIEIPVAGRSACVGASNPNEVIIPLEKGTEVYSYIECRRFTYAPVYKGEEAGKVVFYSGDKKIAETAICYDEDYIINEGKRSFFEKITDFFRKAGNFVADLFGKTD